jgi:hypothetical protein
VNDLPLAMSSRTASLSTVQKTIIRFLACRRPVISRPDFFRKTLAEDTPTLDLKLTSRAAAEAVISLWKLFAPPYIRSLRLEERYSAGDAAIQSLEELKTRQGVPVGWPWP